MSTWKWFLCAWLASGPSTVPKMLQAALCTARRKTALPVIGSVGAGNVFSECHEGAIYLHRGRQFHVAELDIDRREVRVRGVRVP